jgi:hypothetical protein
MVKITTDGGICRQENRMNQSAIRPNAEWLRPQRFFGPKQRAERLKTATLTPRHPRSADVSSRRRIRQRRYSGLRVADGAGMRPSLVEISRSPECGLAVVKRPVPSSFWPIIV